jgi:spore coat protein U-like protein
MRPIGKRTAALVALLAVLGAPASGVASVTSCTVTVSGIDFGTYTPLQSSALDINGTINIACTGVTANNSVTIDLSTGLSNSYMTRTLVSGASTLSYNLYLDAGYTQVWGNGTGTSGEGSVTITNGHPNATLAIYGAVAAGQDPAPGSYADMIQVSVNY